MEALFQAVAENDRLVYILCFVLVFIETAGLPLPALTFALLAAMLAGQGSLGFVPCVIAVILGGTVGGPVGYRLGVRRGRPLLESIGGRVKLTPERLDSTQEQFERRGKVVVLARYWVPILPWATGIMAGIVEMPRRTFLFFNFLSITLWALIQMTIVAFFSTVLQDIMARITFTTIFWLTTGAIGTFALIRWFRRRRQKREQAKEEQESGEDAAPELSTAPTTLVAAVDASEPEGVPSDR
jgi:membrane protein DedA with SNARE-associated domain